MKKNQTNQLEKLFGNTNKLHLIKSYQNFQAHIDLECERTKKIVRNSLSDLLDIPNSLDFLYNEQFLEQLTIVIRQIYKRYFQLELSQKYATFTKHLFFLFQCICEQIILEQKQVYEDQQFGRFKKNQGSPSKTSLTQNEQFHNLQKDQFELSSNKAAENHQSYDNINQFSKNSSVQQQDQQNSINSLQLNNSNNLQNNLDRIKASNSQTQSNSIQSSPKQDKQKVMKKVINKNTSWQQIDFKEPENQLDFMTTVSACTFSQSPRFEKKRESSPGPCDYNIESGIKATKTNSPAFQISQQERNFIQHNQTLYNPSPQAYSPSIRFKSK